MSGHHLLIENGYMSVECSEPPNAGCRAVFDCFCDEPYDVKTTDDGTPYHMPGPGDDDDLHVGRFVPEWCNVAEWFSAVNPEDLLNGERTIPLRVEWGLDGPTLNLPEQTEETP